MKNIHRHIMKTVDKVSRTVVRSIDGTKEIKTVSNANIVINSLDANIRMYVIYNMVDIENYYVSQAIDIHAAPNYGIVDVLALPTRIQIRFTSYCMSNTVLDNADDVVKSKGMNDIDFRIIIISRQTVDDGTLENVRIESKEV